MLLLPSRACRAGGGNAIGVRAAYARRHGQLHPGTLRHRLDLQQPPASPPPFTRGPPSSRSTEKKPCLSVAASSECSAVQEQRKGRSDSKRHAVPGAVEEEEPCQGTELRGAICRCARSNPAPGHHPPPPAVPSPGRLL